MRIDGTGHMLDSIEKGNVQEAARLFLASNTDSLSPETLVEFQKSVHAPRTNMLAWWRQMAFAWHSVNEDGAAAICLTKARRIISEGTGAPDLAELRALSDLQGLLNRSGHRKRSSRHRTPSRRTEGPKPKSERLKDLFGRGSTKRAKEQFEHFVRSGDLVCALLSITPDTELLDDITDLESLLLLSEAYSKKGEYHIAAEMYQYVFADVPLEEWLKPAAPVLIDLGLALDALGDHISAFACFRLALTLRDTPADSTASKDSDPKEHWVKIASEQIERLQWAKPHLSSDADSFRPFVGGLRLASWMFENGLAGRIAGYLDDPLGDDNFRSSRRLDAWSSAWRALPARSLRRQMGWLCESRKLASGADEPGGTSNWSRRDVDEFRQTLNGHSRDLPLAPATTLFKRFGTFDASHGVDTIELSSTGDRWGLTSGEAHLLFPRLDEPPELSTTHLKIGYTLDGANTTGRLPLAVGAPLLATGPAIDSDFLTSALDQMQERGWKVLWVTSGPVDNMPEQILTITDSNSPNEGLQYLRMALSGDSRWKASLLDLLRDLYPVTRGDGSDQCLEAAVSDEFLKSLGEEDTPIPELAVALVSKYCQLRFRSPREFRRAVLLIDYIRSPLSALRAALRFQWDTPDSNQPVNRAVIQIKDSTEPVLALATMFHLGWAVHCIEEIQNARRAGPETPPTDTTDFPLKVSPRKKNGGADAPREPSRPDMFSINNEPSNQGRDWLIPIITDRDKLLVLMQSPWIKNLFLDAVNHSKLCVIIGETWSPAWKHILPWFRMSENGAKYCLLLGAKSLPHSFFQECILREIRVFLLGPMPEDKVISFQGATGLSLGPDHLSHLVSRGAASQTSDDDPLNREAVLINRIGGPTTFGNVFVWPENRD